MDRIEKLYNLVRSHVILDLSDGRCWWLGRRDHYYYLRSAYWCGTGSSYDRIPCREIRRLIAQLIRTGRLVSLGDGRWCAAEDHEEIMAIDDRPVTVAERGVW